MFLEREANQSFKQCAIYKISNDYLKDKLIFEIRVF